MISLGELHLVGQSHPHRRRAPSAAAGSGSGSGAPAWGSSRSISAPSGTPARGRIADDREVALVGHVERWKKASTSSVLAASRSFWRADRRPRCTGGPGKRPRTSPVGHPVQAVLVALSPLAQHHPPLGLDFGVRPSCRGGSPSDRPPSRGKSRGGCSARLVVAGPVDARDALLYPARRLHDGVDCGYGTWRAPMNIRCSKRWAKAGPALLLVATARRGYQRSTATPARLDGARR